MDNRIDDLLDLIEAEPDGLRVAEMLQAQTILEGLVGKSIAGVAVEDRRITITTSDGKSYVFYGFLGSPRE